MVVSEGWFGHTEEAGTARTCRAQVNCWCMVGMGEFGWEA